MKNLIKSIFIMVFFGLVASIWAYFNKSSFDKITYVYLMTLFGICGFLLSSVFNLQDKVEELENKIDNLK